MPVKELQERLDKRGWQVEWADLINALEGAKEIKIETGDKEVLLKSDLSQLSSDKYLG